MKELTSELKSFLQNKVYVLLVGITALAAYGFAVTHYSVGMDDTAISLYFEEGMAPFVGRWTLFLLVKIFRLHIAEFAPWFVELISVLILVLSVTIWCVLWKRVCEPEVKLPAVCYAVTAGIFISCPLISEVYVFYLHNGVCLGYGLTALALICFLNSLENGAERKEVILQLLSSSFLLCIALGCYESFLTVYAVGAILLFALLRILYGKANGSGRYKITFPAWLVRGIAALAVAILERTVILAALKAAFHLDRLSVYDVQYRSFFGDIFTAENELQMVLKRFFMKYYVNALVYLPITILVLALAFIGVCCIVYGIRRKDVLLPVCFAALLLLPVAMSLVEGLATRYRSAQYVPVVSAFAAFLLFLFLYSCNTGRVVRCIAGLFLGILLFNQCADMNKWFYLDYLKYQDAERVMEQVAYDLKKEYDTSKPIVFRGGYRVPYSIAKETYVSFDSWQYRTICRLTDWFDEHLKEKYYAEETSAYCYGEMAIVSTLQWGVTAFDGTSGQLIRFWEMMGISGLSCETDQSKIDEAEQIRTEENMPCYPQEGYIRETEDYIIVNLAN